MPAVTSARTRVMAARPCFSVRVACVRGASKLDDHSARWKTDSRRADVVQVRATVIAAVKDALDEAGIDMPGETQVQLRHDQTEATGGERGAQREGWSAPKVGKTQPRWKAESE